MASGNCGNASNGTERIVLDVVSKRASGQAGLEREVEMRVGGGAAVFFPWKKVSPGACCWLEHLPATTATTNAKVNLIRRLRQTLDMALVYVESGCRALKTPLRLPAKCGAMFKYFASWREVGEPYK